jgi:signal transduction histidine kinase
MGDVYLSTVIDTATTIIEMLVADLGLGIAPDRLADIFSPFTHAKLPVYREHGGDRLGLSIPSRLVSLIGGKFLSTRLWEKVRPLPCAFRCKSWRR